MRTVRLDLELSGTRLRVLCHDPAAGGVLRRELADHLVDPEDAAPPTAFVLQAPKPGQSLFVLLDRSGYVLGRTRTGSECAELLARHLGAFLDPPGASTRLMMRAIVDDQRDALVLAGFPLFTVPALTERQLHRSSFAIVDRLVSDIDDEQRMVGTPSPWSTLDIEVHGHRPPPTGAKPVAGLLLPGNASSAPTPAQVVAFVAGTALTTDRHEALRVAERLAPLPALSVSFDSRTARHQGLITLRGGSRTPSAG